MKTTLYVSLSIIACVLALIPRGLAKPVEDVLNKTNSVEINAVRIAQVARELSKLFLVPICMEEAQWFDRVENTRSHPETPEHKRARAVNLMVKDASLRAILDRLVTDYPKYQWEFDETNCVVNIYPREEAVSDLVFEDVHITNRSIRDMLLFNDDLGLKDHEIDFNPGVTGNPAWSRDEKLSLQGGQIRLRDLLNQICIKLAEPRCWTIEQWPYTGMLWDGTGRKIRYDLKFHAYLPLDPYSDPNVRGLYGTNMQPWVERIN